MAVPVLVYGKSGSGKSRSLKNFDEDEIYLVNVLGKMMPFKGQLKYITKTDDVQKIMSGLVKMPTNAAVIDDFGYIMTNMWMRGHGSGDQFKLYTSSMSLSITSRQKLSASNSSPPFSRTSTVQSSHSMSS